MPNSKNGTASQIDLDQYRKENSEKLDSWTTSVHLEKRHETFLHAENLNLSKLVRDMLDGLMGSRDTKNTGDDST